MTNKDKMQNIITVDLEETLEELGGGCLMAYEFEDYPIEEVFPAMSTNRVNIGGEEYFIEMEVRVTKIKS